MGKPRNETEPSFQLPLLASFPPPVFAKAGGGNGLERGLMPLTAIESLGWGLEMTFDLLANAHVPEVRA